MQRAFLLTLTMIAFAANSILNRMAVDGGHADPGSFAVIRVLAGAITLVVLARLQGARLVFATRLRAVGAAALATYMVGFSVGYLTLDAGLGALILFGSVQITVFVAASLGGMTPTGRQIAGATIALVGLAVVLNPSAAGQTSALGAFCMVAAGIGWGIYTMAGRRETDALAATAANFCLALPLTCAAPLIAGFALQMTPAGLGLAVLSGAVTSGCGYALWYRYLPGLQPAVAGVLMLSVPVIAVAAGALLLGETLGLTLLAGGVLVLGGIALSVLRPGR